MLERYPPDVKNHYRSKPISKFDYCKVCNKATMNTSFSVSVVKHALAC